MTLPEGATDASLAPYHVARSKLFVRERGANATLIHLDTAQIEANIEHTRFPVPEDELHESTDDFPGLACVQRFSLDSLRTSIICASRQLYLTSFVRQE